MICPMLGDQHFWKRLLVDRGVSATTRFRALDHASLLRGLQMLVRPDVVAAAAALGDQLRAVGDGAM
jgi:hypothetical protein